jgi:glycosyltransferase involved in cell wall biosynthesis
VRLLFVCERLPWPADSGPAVRTLAQLRGLAEHGHELELVVFAAPGSTPPPPPDGLSVQVTTVDSPGEATAADWLRDGGASELPWAVRQRSSSAMRTAVAQSAEGADAVVAVKLPMAQYLEGVAGPLRVYDALDVESLALAQIARLGGGGLARIHAAREAKAVERYERQLADLANVVTTVTDEDAAALGALAPGLPIRPVPIGLDVTEYASLWELGTPQLAFFGDLGWRPNSDAAIHLCEEVLPLLLRRPRVTIAGRRPGADVRRLAGPGIAVTGAVPAMDAVLTGDTVAVAPLRAGTGMRVKLLEAMAWGLPGVTSTIGCAGIDHAGALVVADGPGQTAAAIAALLADGDRRAELSRAGRELVAARYGYRESAAGLVAAIEAG